MVQDARVTYGSPQLKIDNYRFKPFKYNKHKSPVDTKATKKYLTHEKHIEHVGHMSPIEPIQPIKAAEQIETIEHIPPIEPIERIEFIDGIHPMQTIEQEESAERDHISKHIRPLYVARTAKGAVGVTEEATGVVHGATGVMFPATGAIGVTEQASGVTESATGVIEEAMGVKKEATGVTKEAKEAEGASKRKLSGAYKINMQRRGRKRVSSSKSIIGNCTQDVQYGKPQCNSGGSKRELITSKKPIDPLLKELQRLQQLIK